MSLRVLVVSKESPITGRLQEAGHEVTFIDERGAAVEALQLQKFDVVVLGPDLALPDMEILTREVQQLNRQSSTRTAVLGVSAEGRLDCSNSTELDGYLPDRGTPEALSAALINLAVRSPLAEYSDPRGPDLPVLNIAELQEQLDYDNELLVELIGLFVSERQRQSMEMRAALATGDLTALSRLVHTIKGSLGSLQAPSGRAHAQLLEKAALDNDRHACELLLPDFDLKLDRLEVELQALGESLTQVR